MQIILAIGARVIVSDVRQERLEAAMKIGVPQEDIVPVNTSVQQFIEERKLEIDTTIDFAGVSQTFRDAQLIGTYVVHNERNTD